MKFFKKNRKKTELTPQQKASRRKNLRRASVSTAGIAVALAAVVLLNLVCTNLTDRYDLNLDLTAGKLYEISDDTKTMLENLDRDITLTVLMDETSFQTDSYLSKVNTLIGKYQNLAGDHLTVEYIDPYTNPNIAERFSDVSSSLQEGSVILTCGDSQRVLNTTDFYEVSTDSYSSYVTGFQGEQALTSAIHAVTSDAMPAVYVLQGHNESVSTQFSTMLTGAGYTIDALNLTEKSIPEDAAILVLSLPQTDYTETEVDALDAFVKAGGDLMVFDGTASPTELPVLYAYLQEWGASVQADMVLDADYNISTAPDILAQLTDSTLNDDLASQTDAVLVTPNSKSITVSTDFDDRTVETLMESRNTSYVKVLTDETEYDSYEKADGDAEGSFPLAVLTNYTGNDNGGQVFVCTSALMMTDDLMQATSLMNTKFLKNVVAQLQPDTDVISVESKSLTAEPLVIGSTATYVVFTVLALIPIGLFAWGIFIFLRRRKL